MQTQSFKIFTLGAIDHCLLKNKKNSVEILSSSTFQFDIDHLSSPLISRMNLKHSSLRLLTLSLTFLLYLKDVFPVSQSNSRKRTKPELPDLNLPVTSPSGTNEAEIVVSHHDSTEKKNDREREENPRKVSNLANFLL